ncbi:MAG: hypothetical protein RSA66_10200 [Muribaculaceae bacterium]
MGKLKNIVIVVVVMLLVVSVLLNVRYCRLSNECSTNDTTLVTVIDTIPYHLPTPTKENNVKKTTAKLPIAESGNDDEENISDDSINVVVPVTQKVYEDSTYRAYVSGYMPILDSIIIYPRHDVMTITKSIKEKRKRWGVGIQVGYGMTIKGTPELSPYIGIGISYNLFSF